MRRRRLASVISLVAVATAVGFALSADARSTAVTSLGARAAAAGVAGGPLDTGILDPESLNGPEREIAYGRVRQAGARFVRMFVNWADIVPGGASKPAVFKARDPNDPQYQWDSLDSQVRMAVAKGYTPIVYFQSAPAWAQQKACPGQGTGPCRPSPSAVADFMTAAALRYRGGYQGLPRVRYWQIWNEPNLSWYLMPQANADGQPLAPDVYRPMVNAAADAIHAVRKDNVVIAGGLAPFGHDDEKADASSPLLFMRKLLCLSEGPRPKPVCRKRVRFDIWSHHPYTSGGPRHHAAGPDDISLPDLWKMRVLLEAAAKAGNLQSREPVRFWVTEFGWDTNPPDPEAVPEKLQSRWVAEGLYRMWSQGVSLVTWFLIRDQPFSSKTPFQSGLYFRGPDGIASDKPKLTLRAFRFPFVAFREPKRKSVMFWGRSPAGGAAVIVEQKKAGDWRLVATLRPNGYGIFSGRFPSAATRGYLRARLKNGKDSALPFPLVPPPDRPGCVWGTC